MTGRAGPIETIRHEDEIVALVIYKDYEVDGIKFLSPNDFTLQLGHMHRPSGYIRSFLTCTIRWSGARLELRKCFS